MDQGMIEKGLNENKFKEIYLGDYNIPQTTFHYDLKGLSI
jgi:hypothetical protein